MASQGPSILHWQAKRAVNALSICPQHQCTSHVADTALVMAAPNQIRLCVEQFFLLLEYITGKIIHTRLSFVNYVLHIRR